MDFARPVQAVIPGAQGRLLAVLAETTSELNLRTLARLAGISIAQASRVMPALVELGLVERREVPPSSQFRLNRDHVATEPIVALSRSRERALRRIGEAAVSLPVPPISIVVFGSFARSEAGPGSDLDALVVRPEQIDEDDDRWATGIEQWREQARAITGSTIEVIEVDRAEARRRFASKGSLWRDIARDGTLVHGVPVADLIATDIG